MAQSLTEVTPKLLAQGLMALRTNCVMPRLVNRDYDNMAAQKGATIDVPIPSAVDVQSVTAGQNPASSTKTELNPTSVAIKLDNWYEASFYLSDKEIMDSISGIIPMQASEAISALADKVDKDILDQYENMENIVGVAGTTPFSGTSPSPAIALEAGQVLSEKKAPKNNRRIVIDPEAEANALGLKAFQYASYAGSVEGIRDGEINRKLGFDWHMDQNISKATKTGTASGQTVRLVNEAGAKTIRTKTSSAADVFVAGDFIEHVRGTAKYTYLVTKTQAVSGSGYLLTITPPLRVATVVNDAINIVEPVVNLAFHRDAIAFVTRPLEDEGNGLGNIIQSQVDPVSGLALRLEISREYKRTRFSYDVLYGVATVRPEFGVMVLG